MDDPKKGTEFVCGVCGTTLVVSAEAVGVLEDVVCCEKPMEVRKSVRGKTSPKKKPHKGKK